MAPLCCRKLVNATGPQNFAIQVEKILMFASPLHSQIQQRPEIGAHIRPQLSGPIRPVH